MEAPRRCPLLRGPKFVGPQLCHFTKEKLGWPEVDKCDNSLRSYLSCEYFSRWYWGGKKQKARVKQLNQICPVKEVNF